LPGNIALLAKSLKERWCPPSQVENFAAQKRIASQQNEMWNLLVVLLLLRQFSIIASPTILIETESIGLASQRQS
jgi:hypothetical protein